MALYYFIDAAGERKLIGTSNLRFTGAWSGSTSYQPRDVANDGYGHYWMALVANTNVAQPSTFDTSVPTTWTHLVLSEDSPLSPEDQAIATALAAEAVATAALTTAWVGTDAPTALAEAAMAVATSALETSWVGTGAAANAQSEGDAAYALARAAYTLAATGTDTPVYQEALNVATAALATSWAGTADGQSAYALAQSAYALATSGTVTSFGTLPPSSGTVIFDMAGPAWQKSSVEGNVAVTAISMAVPVTNIQSVTGYIEALANVNLTWDTFTWFGTTGPTSLDAGKTLLVSLSSTTASVNGVFAVASSQV